MTVTIFTEIADAFKSLETKFVNWVNSEETLIESSLGAGLITALEGILTSLKPSIVADIQTILQSLPGDFIKGATFSDIATEVVTQAEGDTKAEIQAAAPQVLEAIVGILVNVLLKV